VNNAALFEPDEIGSLDAMRFDRQMAVNLRAPIFLAEAFARQAGEGASIVNMLDQRVLKPTPHFVSYTLAKAALHTAIAPGPTMASARQSPDDFAKQSAAVPLGRGPSPEEVAAAVCYLAGARSVTGVTLAVDGGQHLAWDTPDASIAE
jgi:NAD(P)-dependent dehydrogenase (short-subunit alcohol dehydrogenase family)